MLYLLQEVAQLPRKFQEYLRVNLEEQLLSDQPGQDCGTDRTSTCPVYIVPPVAVRPCYQEDVDIQLCS